METRLSPAIYITPFWSPKSANLKYGMSVLGYGKKNGEETAITIDLIDYYEEETGFTAMERLTGWHCAIMMGFQARGQVPAGGVSMEIAVPAAVFMQAVRERGIKFEVRYE
jgi:saccharopine dehydrogenase-like NADP-dependent oxidoreductase